MSRPDYIRCVGHTHGEQKGQTWCGRKNGAEAVFGDLDSVAYAHRADKRAVACPECVREATKHLSKHLAWVEDAMKKA